MLHETIMSIATSAHNIMSSHDVSAIYSVGRIAFLLTLRSVPLLLPLRNLIEACQVLFTLHILRVVDNSDAHCLSDILQQVN